MMMQKAREKKMRRKSFFQIVILISSHGNGAKSFEYNFALGEIFISGEFCIQSFFNDLSFPF